MTVIAATTPASDPATLLLVDDEPSILSALRRLLRPLGHRILVAEGGLAGLEIARAEPIDLIVSDMRMPGLDGAQFLEQARAIRPEAARILLTGYADISSTIAAVNAGRIHRYVAKPWDDQALLLVIRECLAMRALERRNQELADLAARQNDELRALNAGLEDRVRQRSAEISQVNDMLQAAYGELEVNFMRSMQVFAGLLELRHKTLAGRSARIAVWAARVCVRLKMDQRCTRDVQLAALLHDIGKVSFPDALLSKPVSTMNPGEIARYRQHVLEAESALLPLAQLREAARIIRAQHERVDGGGFPDGLAGDEIPQGAKILAPIIDYAHLLDGTLSERRLSPDDAQAAIRRASGSRYAQDVVAALVDVLNEPEPESLFERRIPVSELKPGMVLARDLVSPQGLLLLAAGYAFDEHVVRHVRDYAARSGAQFTLQVRVDPAPQPQVRAP